MNLQQLNTPAGMQQLVAVTGGARSPYAAPEMQSATHSVLSNALRENPALATTTVVIRPGFPNAYYNVNKNEIVLGIVDPNVLAHELEHADSMQQHGLYRKVLQIAHGVSQLNHLAALPTVLALRTFLKDKGQRDDILKTLAAVSAAAAAPGLMEEASANIGAVRNSPNKLEAIRTLGPGFMAHIASGMSPSLIYQLGRM